MSAADLIVTVHPPDANYWRQYRADKARQDPKARPDAVWVAKELVYWCTVTAPQNAYYVVVTSPLGLADAAAWSPSGGRRVVRLLYEWAAIEPHLHMDSKALSAQVLSAMASEGNMLRAGVAYAASGRNSGGNTQR